MSPSFSMNGNDLRDRTRPRTRIIGTTVIKGTQSWKGREPSSKPSTRTEASPAATKGSKKPAIARLFVFLNPENIFKVSLSSPPIPCLRRDLWASPSAVSLSAVSSRPNCPRSICSAESEGWIWGVPRSTAQEIPRILVLDILGSKSYNQ